MALIGFGLGGIGVYKYIQTDGDNKRYKTVYTGKEYMNK